MILLEAEVDKAKAFCDELGAVLKKYGAHIVDPAVVRLCPFRISIYTGTRTGPNSTAEMVVNCEITFESGMNLSI